MSEKLYTVDEANALLPYLAPTLVELREKLEAAEQARDEIDRAAATNGGSSDRDRWTRTMARATELLDRLQEWELVLRDATTGLIDFPAVVEGVPGWLCWRLGEPEVAFWHPRDEGFGSRRPL